MDKKSINFVLNEFPTHVAYTKSVKNPKYIKVNYQNIYNGRINMFSRAIMVGNLHKYISENISEGSPLGKNLDEEIEIHTVVNHDTISRRKDSSGNYRILWKPPEIEYVPRWDIENLASIWSKVINDTLIELNYLEDDTIDYIQSIKYKFIPIDNINERKIIIKFYRNDNTRRLLFFGGIRKLFSP